MEIQDLPITKKPWFPEYVKACVENEILQKSWKPAIGDWFERHYHLDLSPLIIPGKKQIEILSYKSSALGYWHTTSAQGVGTLWKSQEEMLKGTSKWIPRFDQLIVENTSNYFAGSVFDIHMQALQCYLNRLVSQSIASPSHVPA